MAQESTAEALRLWRLCHFLWFSVGRICSKSARGLTRQYLAVWCLARRFVYMLVVRVFQQLHKLAPVRLML